VENAWICKGLVDGEACPREVVNGLCHEFTDGNGLRLCEGLIDGESCPREVVNGL
jgi:methyl coenzyme M reductase subunit C